MKALRLFIAIHPPIETAQRAIDAAREALHGCADDGGTPEYRLTPVEQVHLTLQFIGDTPPRELENVRESIARSASGLVETTLTWQRLIRLPERGPARLVAAETDAPATIAELKHRLVERLARNVRRKESKPFLPHLTLCRFRSPTRLRAMDAPLALPPFDVREIRLMRSTLRPGGAVHEAVSTFALGASGGRSPDATGNEPGT